MSQRGRARPRRYTRPEPQHDEAPTDGPAWLASMHQSLSRALEEHEKGGKHRPSPPDGDIRSVARDLDAARRDTK